MEINMYACAGANRPASKTTGRLDGNSRVERGSSGVPIRAVSLRNRPLEFNAQALMRRVCAARQYLHAAPKRKF